jgi:hypothetical protein
MGETKSKYIGFRITPECDEMLSDLAKFNKTNKSDVIRRVFLYVPKLHALIPEEELKKIREEK